MSEKPAIYRLRGNKILCVAFHSPQLKLDGGIAPYHVPNECAQNVGASAQATDETDYSESRFREAKREQLAFLGNAPDTAMSEWALGSDEILAP